LDWASNLVYSGFIPTRQTMMIFSTNPGKLAFMCIAVAFSWIAFAPVMECQTSQSSLRASVRDSRGKAIEGATLRLQAKTGSNAITAVTDANGSYEFTGLTPGLYSLHAEMKGQGEATASSILLRPDELKTVDVVLAAAAFYDPPQFTVSGVTDTTSLGGHGSDSVVRTRDTLAKETAGLAHPGAVNGYPVPSERALREQVQETQKLLEHDNSAELHHLLADLQERLGDSLSAVREYQRAAEMSPREPYLFDWGAELLLHHAPEPAQEVFTRAHRIFPKSARILIGLGSSLLALGSYDDAVQRVCEASDLNPGDLTPYLILGKMDEIGSVKSAVLATYLQRFASLHPNSAQSNYYYAVALWKRRTPQQNARELAQVESLLKKAVGLDPHLGAAYLQLGILHAEKRDFSQAIADYRQAMQASPGLKEAHYRLAQAYRQTGEEEKAKVEIEIYERMSREAAQQADRERHEIRQFVYTLRDQPQPQPE